MVLDITDLLQLVKRVLLMGGAMVVYWVADLSFSPTLSVGH